MVLTWPLEQQGSTGEDVRTVQYLVTAQGHPTGVDGNFGPQTKAAVQAFQASRGLGADGIVGPRTWPQKVPTFAPGLTSIQNGFANAASAGFGIGSRYSVKPQCARHTRRLPRAGETMLSLYQR